MFSLGNIGSIRGFEVVAGHDVVDVVDASGSHSDFGEVNGPDASVGIFCLILGEVGGIDVVVDVSVSFVPLLIVILFEVVVGRMNSEVFTNPSC